MKRHLTAFLLLFTLLAAHLAFVAPVHAQQTIFTPNCTGTNDTSAFSAIIATIGSNQGTISLPYGNATRCAVNNLMIPGNITLDNTYGSGIKVNTGQTLTVVGPITGAAGKPLFYNATSGGGAISFAGNASVAPFYAQWWGVTADGTTDDLAALQAAINATPDGGTLVLPPGSISITNTVRINNRLSLRIIGGLFPFASGYVEGSTRIVWNGAAGGIMVQMINSDSCVWSGVDLKLWGTTASNGAGYGIFSGPDYNIGLTVVNTTAGSATITYDPIALVNQLPNGDLVHKGRTITIPGAGAAGATYTGTVLNITTTSTNTVNLPPPGFSETMTVTPAPSTTITGGTASIPNPYGTHDSSSHVFQNFYIDWSGATNDLSYRTGIANDLYLGQNQERILIRNVRINGSGGAAATTSSTKGIGISFGGYYKSGSMTNPVSPLSGYGGGSNVLQCDISDVFIYGVSFGIHGMNGTLSRIQGSFINVAFFGSMNATIINSRFEGNRQFLHGAGSINLIGNQWASAVSGTPLIEIYGGNSRFTMTGSQRNFGGIFDNTGTKTVQCTSPTNCIGTFSNNDRVDILIFPRKGEDYTGFNAGVAMEDDGLTVLGGAPIIQTAGYPAGALPGFPVGTTIYCFDCTEGSNPCTGGSTGAFADRIGNAASPKWKCR